MKKVVACIFMVDGDLVGWVKGVPICGHCMDQSFNRKASDSDYSLYIF